MLLKQVAITGGGCNVLLKQVAITGGGGGGDHM